MRRFRYAVLVVLLSPALAAVAAPSMARAREPLKRSRLVRMPGMILVGEVQQPGVIFLLQRTAVDYRDSELKPTDLATRIESVTVKSPF